MNAQEQDNNIVITIEDEGEGMTAEAVEQIFDPFYTTMRGTNTGLGLHAVYNQVNHLLKGSIECSSKVNKGTTFILKLPLTC